MLGVKSSHQTHVQEKVSSLVPKGHWGTSVDAASMGGCPAVPRTPGKTGWGWGRGWGRGRATPKQRLRDLRVPLQRVLKVPRVLMKNCLFSLQNSK